MAPMNSRGILVPFLNVGHFVDHLAMLVFPVVVVALAREWQQPYSELLPLALGGFIAFGAFALPAGWLADHWSRYKMMVVFFFGIGAALFLTGFAQSSWQIGARPVRHRHVRRDLPPGRHRHAGGGAGEDGARARLERLVGQPRPRGGGADLGRADGLRSAGARRSSSRACCRSPSALPSSLLVPDPGPVQKRSKTIGLHVDRATMARIFAIMLIATACGGVIFNSTTVAMPKVFDERLAALTQTSFGIGALVAIVYTMAAFAQVLMGTLIDRFELRRLMIGVALVQIPLLALAANLQGWAMLGAALLMMLAIFGQIPLNDAIVGKYVADEYRARVLSVRYVVSLGVAAIAVPLIAVLHKTQGGFSNVFMVLAVLAAGMLLCSFFFPSRREVMQAQSAAATT